MRGTWSGAVVAGLLGLTVLSACTPAGVDSGEQSSEESSVTWEQAKADAQAMELEIVAMIPADQVVSVDQQAKGALFSCDQTQHSWNGSTSVTLTPGSDVESIVKDLETRFLDDDRFESRSRIGLSGFYRVQLMSPETDANFIFSEDLDGTFRIASGSVCFTLPEEVYPGGSF